MVILSQFDVSCSLPSQNLWIFWLCKWWEHMAPCVAFWPWCSKCLGKNPSVFPPPCWSCRCPFRFACGVSGAADSVLLLWRIAAFSSSSPHAAAGFHWCHSLHYTLLRLTGHNAYLLPAFQTPDWCFLCLQLHSRLILECIHVSYWVRSMLLRLEWMNKVNVIVSGHRDDS